jgi:peptide/nickel transport system permease protein
MLWYVGRRVGMSVLMLALTSVLIFVVLRVLPGDPVTTLVGQTEGIDASQVAQMRHSLGLDRPLIVQYGSWVAGLFSGHFGMSYFSQQPVQTLMGGRIVPTVELTLAALLIAIVIAVPTAIYAAMHPRGIVDRAATAFASLGMSVPSFLAALALIIVFAVKLRWLPTRGYVSIFSDPVQNLKLIVMPAAALAFTACAPILRFLRGSLGEASEAPYIRTAEGKGMLRPTAIRKHATPNALIPTLTIVGMTVGRLLGGVVIIEYIFSWPGLGTLIVDAVFKRDYAVLQTSILFAAAAFIFTTLVVDLLYGVLDPRLKASTAESAA